MTNEVGEVRRSAVVSTFGPGSILDLRATHGVVSGIHAGLEEWDLRAPLEGQVKNQVIREPRLLKKLDKRYFRLPPVYDRPFGWAGRTPGSLVIRRFPDWLQCPKCESLRPAGDWEKAPGKADRYCAACTQRQPGQAKVTVIPTRFVVACTDGHIDDFPWDFWVRHSAGCNRPRNLRLSSRGVGLAGLVVSCKECNQERSMKTAFQGKALAGLVCQGRRPWLRTNDSSCVKEGSSGEYRVLQRGGSNVFYPVIESALDIPPWTSTKYRLFEGYWDDFVNIEDPTQRLAYMASTGGFRARVEREGLTLEQVAVEFQELLDHAEAIDSQKIRVEEFRALSSVIAVKDREFEHHPSSANASLAGVISRTSRVSRLREVRVLKGFTRIHPPYDPSQPNLAPLSAEALDWLPAIEVRGEGIFIALNVEAIQDWLKDGLVHARLRPIAEGWRTEWSGKFPDQPIPFEASPTLILVHSLAHALIRQLTLDCGYSSSALRERIYTADTDSSVAGLLIYTSTSDADGTLGGLQSRAQPETLEKVIWDAMQAMNWCASDPICGLGDLASVDSHSIASCHACTMLPETSCEFNNMFLDRGLLVGATDGSVKPFFPVRGY